MNHLPNAEVENRVSNEVSGNGHLEGGPEESPEVAGPPPLPQREEGSAGEVASLETAPLSPSEEGSTVAEPSANGRDEQGRFAKGNLGGPGNPFARQMAALRQALLDAVTPEDIREIAQSLVAKAREGNLPAARLVLAYAIGKPGPAVDPDALELHEWSIFQRSGIDAREVDKLRHQMPVGVANPLHRVLQPLREQEVGQTMRYMLMSPAEKKKAAREARELEREARRRRKGDAVCKRV